MATTASVTGLLAVIARKMPSSRFSNPMTDRKTALQEAIVKAAMLDIDIAISVYLEAGRRDRRAMRDRLADQFDTALAGVINAIGDTAKELRGSC